MIQMWNFPASHGFESRAAARTPGLLPAIAPRVSQDGALLLDGCLKKGKT